MLLNLTPDKWDVIKDLSDTQKSLLLQSLFIPTIHNDIAIKIAYNYITAKKQTKEPKDTFKQPDVTLDPKTGLLTGITDELFEYYTKLYPKTNIEQELLKIAGWATSKGVRRAKWNQSITKWLAKTESNGGLNGYL